ncbi:hypothetical protein Ndes2526B_g03711 [Nannochloris sp. 'desiccata']
MPRAQRSDMTPEHRMKKPNGIFIVLFIALLLSLARGWRYMKRNRTKTPSHSRFSNHHCCRHHHGPP